MKTLVLDPLKCFDEDKEEEVLLEQFSLIKEEFINRIAIPFNNENDEIFYKFEDSVLFKVYEITSTKAIVNEYIVEANDNLGTDKINTLLRNDVRVILTNTIDDNTYVYGKNLGLGIIVGIEGRIENILQDFLDNKLISDKSRIKIVIEHEH